MSTEPFCRLKEDVIVQQDIKKSKFITYLMAISTEDEAKEKLKEIRKLHPKAAHHCSAFRCEEITRSSDDGEPSSSAGLPILTVLQGHHLDHVLCVVVRYFGGTLLGVGGLIQAYSSSTALAVNAAVLLYPQRILEYQLRFPYAQINPVESSLEATDLIVDRQYDDQVSYTVKSQNQHLEAKLIESTNGKINVSFIRTYNEYREVNHDR